MLDLLRTAWCREHPSGVRRAAAHGHAGLQQHADRVGFCHSSHVLRNILNDHSARPHMQSIARSARAIGTPLPFHQARARNLSCSLACRALPDVLTGNAQLLSLDVRDNALSALPGAWADAGSSLAALPITYCDVSMNRLQVCFTGSGAWQYSATTFSSGRNCIRACPSVLGSAAHMVTPVLV